MKLSILNVENLEFNFLNNIDAIKGLAILLVVVGHCINSETLLHDIIYSFHMPLFFFVAGYLFNFEKWNGLFYKFVLKKAQRLLLPYFISSLLFFAHWFTCECPNPIKDTPVEAIKNIFVNHINGTFYGIGVHNIYQPLDFQPIGPMWFLPCLFCSMILFYGFIKFVQNRGILVKVLIPIATAFTGWYISKFIYLPWSFDITLFILGFMYCGYLLRNSNIVSLITKYYKILLPILLIIYLFTFNNSCILLNSRIYHNIVYSYIASISMCIIIFITFQLFKDQKFKILSKLGIISMIILCFHDRLKCLLVDTSWITYYPITKVIYLVLYCYAIAIVISYIPILNRVYFNNRSNQVFKIQN